MMGDLSCLDQMTDDQFIDAVRDTLQIPGQREEYPIVSRLERVITSLQDRLAALAPKPVPVNRVSEQYEERRFKDKELHMLPTNGAED